MQKITTDRTEIGQGPRTREFARIDRETGPETSDPKVMRLLRQRPSTRRSERSAAGRFLAGLRGRKA